MNALLKLILVLVGHSIAIVALHAQDERYFRDLLSGDLTREVPPEIIPPRYRVFAPLYELDLNGNHRFERLVFEMRDAQDWLSILDYQKNPIFRYHLGPNAPLSRVYRLRKVQINSDYHALVVYYFEGVNSYLGIHANARAHVITFRPDQMEQTMKGFKGPAFWEEFHNGREHYRRRSYELDFIDLNNDGTKEMILKFKNISRIYQFSNDGKWSLI